MKTKIMAGLLCGALVVSLAACGGGQALPPQSESIGEVIEALARGERGGQSQPGPGQDAQAGQEEGAEEPPEEEVANPALLESGEFAFTVEDFYAGVPLEAKTGLLQSDTGDYTLAKVEYVGGDIYCYTLPGSARVSAVFLTVDGLHNTVWSNNNMSLAGYILDATGTGVTFKQFLQEELAVEQLEYGVTESAEVKGVALRYTPVKNNYGYHGGILLATPANGTLDTGALGTEIVREGDFLADKELRTELYEFGKAYQYDAAAEVLRRYIAENDPEENDTAYLLLPLYEEMATLTPLLAHVYDEFTDKSTAYYPGVQGLSQYVCLVPSLDEYDRLSLVIGFQKSGWLFFEKVEIKVGEGEYIRESYKYDQVTRDVLSGSTIQEYARLKLDDDDIARILNAGQPPMVRFTDDSGKTHDHTMTDTELEALGTLFAISRLHASMNKITNDYDKGLL